MAQANLVRTRGKAHKEWASFTDRTLDETYYPGLDVRALDRRNNDQVVSHSTATYADYRSYETGVNKLNADAPILTVPQIWLWVVNGVVVSAHNPILNTDDGIETSVEKAIGAMGEHDRVRWRHQHRTEIMDSAYTQAEGRRAALRADRPSRNLDVDEEKAFDMLQGSGQLAHILSPYVDHFGKRVLSNTGVRRSALDHFELRIVGILNEAHTYISMGESGRVNFDQERYLIHVVSDVRSELAMIRYVLAEQELLIDEFIRELSGSANRLFWPKQEPEYLVPGVRKLNGSKHVIHEYNRRVSKIDSDAERIEKSIQDMLNLKRTHASIKDAHSSLVLGTAVIGFTVVTIVFAPLAFLTALFSLKVQGFEKLQVRKKDLTNDNSQDGVYHSGKLGGVFCMYELENSISHRADW
jgi:hypothetical protein